MLLIIILFNSCNKYKKYYDNYETFTKFPTTEKYQINNFADKKFMLPPIDMAIINDKYLIIENEDGSINQMVLIFDLNKEIVIKGFGNKGKGPGEFINITSILEDKNDTLYIYDNSKKTMNIYNINNVLNNNKILPEIEKKMNMNEGDPWALCMLDNKIIATGAFINGALCFYNLDLFPIKTTGELPKIITNRMEKYLYLQTTNIVKNINKQKIVFARRNDDILEIYNFDGKKLKTIQGPDIIEPSWLAKRIEFKDRIYTYNSLATDNNYIFAVYAGKKKEKPGNWINAQGKNIFVFDWNGNPIKKITTDFHILSIVASEKRKKLFMIYFDGEYFRIGYIDISDMEGK